MSRQRNSIIVLLFVFANLPLVSHNGLLREIVCNCGSEGYAENREYYIVERDRRKFNLLFEMGGVQLRIKFAKERL